MSISTQNTDELLASWATGVESLWIAGAVDDAAKRTVRVAANDGKGANNRILNSVAAVAALPATAHCKWFVTLGGDRNFVNPRVIQAVVQGLPHDTLKVYMGFIWKDMGFTDGVSAAAGGDMILSRVTWDALAAAIVSPANVVCKSKDSKDDSITTGTCLLSLGIAPTDLHLIDTSGALQQNGVPLEPGPPDGSRLAWLQQTPTRGGNWAFIDNLNPDKVNELHSAFLMLYGPWGKLPTAAASAKGASASPTPAAGGAARDYAPAPAAAPPCAAAALAAQRDLLDRGRTSPTGSMPLSLDVAYETTRDACSPKKVVGAPGIPRTHTSHMCYVVAPNGGDVAGQSNRVRNYWGSTMSWAKGDAGRQLWLVGGAENVAEGVYAVPGWDARGGRIAALKSFAADPDAAHCRFVYFGAFDDWVNTIAMQNLVRGVRSDVPAAIGFHLVGDKGYGGVEAPAKGRVLYSRAALDVLAARIGAGTCVDTPSDEGDHVSVARCAWAAGIVPIHTARFDVFDMGPSTDWAFQVPNYLLGLAMTIDQYQVRNQQIYCAYFFGTYGEAFGHPSVLWSTKTGPASDSIQETLMSWW